MQALTKKHHTDNERVTINLQVKKRNAAKVKAFAASLEDEERNYTMEEVFPQFGDNIQGVSLKGYRHREDLTQKQLAELTGIPQRHISEMENGKRPLGKENARRLAEALNMDYRMLL